MQLTRVRDRGQLQMHLALNQQRWRPLALADHWLEQLLRLR